MKISFVALCLTLGLFMAQTAAVEAFTVILKSGKRIEGSWHSEDASVIRIKDRDGILLTFKKSLLDWSAMSSTSTAVVKRERDPVQTTVKTEAPISTRVKNSGNSIPHSGSITDSLNPPQAKPQPMPSGRRWLLYANVASVYDTNIDHNEESTDSFGVVYGAGIRLRNRAKEPTFFFDYEIAHHNYTNTDRWDRISQNFKATHLLPINRLFSFQTIGEISLKGSSEDREISDQYILRPGFSYQISKYNQLDFYAAYRIKRFDDRPERNAINKYAGVDFEHDFGKQELEVGYRYEFNNSDDPEGDYYRWTYGVEYSMPWNQHNSISFEVKHRQQRYPSRLVEIDVDHGPDLEVLRFDRRWIFDVEFSILLDSHMELVPTYEYEIRFSNEEGKDFSAHQPRIALRYRW